MYVFEKNRAARGYRKLLSPNSAIQQSNSVDEHALSIGAPSSEGWFVDRKGAVLSAPSDGPRPADAAPMAPIPPFRR